MNRDIAAGRWKQIVGKAKAASRRLTDDESAGAEDCAGRLAGLIRKRHGRPCAEAELAVRRFFANNRDF